MKLDVVSSSIFMVETEAVASSKTFVSFYLTSYPLRWNSRRNEVLFNRCSAACTVFTFIGWMWQCGHIKCSSFSYKMEITHSRILKWIELTGNRNFAFQKPYTKTDVHQAVRVSENGWQHFELVGNCRCGCSIMQITSSSYLPYINFKPVFINWTGDEKRTNSYLFNHFLQLCKLYSIELNMKTWWEDKIWKVVIAFWSSCYVLFSLEQLMQFTTNHIIHYSGCKMKFLVSQSSTEYYQYTSKAAVIKLAFWICWHIMLMMCCRLQEFVIYSKNMTDRWLLEWIGSLHELTYLRLDECPNLTAQALTTFLHRPSMTSIVSLHLSKCFKLDDKGVKGIAERCNPLTYLHV
jgi:hypothetical protein